MIGPKTWDKIWKFLEPIWAVRDCVGNVLGVCFIIYAINCVLVCMRPEMAMDVKPEKILIFLKTGKMVISVKIRIFSKSRMMKRTSPLESSREI